MIDQSYVARVIEDLNQTAVYADYAGNRKMSELMRRSARLLYDMQREAELKQVKQPHTIEHVEIVDG